MIAGGISLRHGGNKTIANIGTISSTGNGAFIWYGTDLMAPIPAGSARATTASIFALSRSATLVNSGTITGATGSPANFYPVHGKQFQGDLGVERDGRRGQRGDRDHQLGRISGLTSVSGVSTLVNCSRITGNGGAGVSLANSDATVMNAGTITGGGGMGVSFSIYNGATVFQGGPLVRHDHRQYGVVPAGADVLVLGTASVLTGALAGVRGARHDRPGPGGLTGAVFSRTTSGSTLSVMNGTATVESLLLARRLPPTAAACSPDGNGGVDINIKQPIGPAITGTYYQTVYLQNYAGQNPFTVGSAGLVSVTSGDAIVGTAGYAGRCPTRGRSDRRRRTAFT